MEDIVGLAANNLLDDNFINHRHSVWITTPLLLKLLKDHQPKAELLYSIGHEWAGDWS